VAVAFEVGGRYDGLVDRYVVRVAGGACTVEADAPADAVVDATLLLEGHEFLRLVLGHLNPVRGVMSGQIRVHGSVIKALGFNAVMRIPGS
jgi:putative sterol carrier protein